MSVLNIADKISSGILYNIACLRTVQSQIRISPRNFPFPPQGCPAICISRSATSQHSPKPETHPPRQAQMETTTPRNGSSYDVTRRRPRWRRWSRSMRDSACTYVDQPARRLVSRRDSQSAAEDNVSPDTAQQNTLVQLCAFHAGGLDLITLFLEHFFYKWLSTTHY